ncbi:MAG: GNAT family N-acetyltransferase [Clostridia bacterium]|nr:GNAT family N-acetyltransferase [Clostridia bacterium]
MHNAAASIRTAQPAEFDAVYQFYGELVSAQAQAQYKVKWRMGVYPTAAYLRDAIEKGQLYLALAGDAIAAAMILNHSCSEDFKNGPWQTKAEGKQALIIHTLGVHPQYERQGYAKALVAHAIGVGRSMGCTAIRLDVIAGHVPALRLYEGLGFCHVGAFHVVFDETDSSDFELYELPL